MQSTDDEKLGFLVPDGDGGYLYKVPDNFHAYAHKSSYNASGTPPAGAAFGMHGHIPKNSSGFLDELNSTDGYGDAQSLGRYKIPMATIARMTDGKYGAGLREVVNGRLQFRVPAGSLTDEQRRKIQDHLDLEQEKFY